MSETENSESAATPECLDSQKDTDSVLTETLDSLEAHNENPVTATGQNENLVRANGQNENPAESTEQNENSVDATGLSVNPAPKKNKVEILFKATGNAPIVKRKKWVVENDKTVGWIINFLKTRLLHLGSNESLFIYVNQSFAPSPDQILRNLYECFGTDGKLILHYCKTQAWG